MSRIARILNQLGKVGALVEDSVLVVLLVGMVLLSAAQILLRNLFDIGFFWSEELLRLMVLWLAVAGAVAATRARKQININLLQNLPASRIRSAINAVAHGFAAFICVVLTKAGADFVATSREFEDLILGGFPAWWFQAALPVGFGLIAYRYTIHTLSDVVAFFRGPDEDGE